MTLSRTDYQKMARQVASAYLKEEADVNQQIADMAKTAGLNTDEVQNLCAHVNYVVHANLMHTKQAQEDQYIEFELARPEKVADLLDTTDQPADQIYNHPERLFHGPGKTAAPTNEGPSAGQYYQQTVRRAQILRQNIKNIGTAHAKLAEEIEMASDHAERKIEQLYQKVKQGLETGKDITLIRDALRKTFNTDEDFDLIWKVVESRLIADGVLERPIKDQDIAPDEIEGYAPNPNADMVAVARDISGYLGRIDELEKKLNAVEKMAAEAEDDLYQMLVMEKEALVGSVGRKFLSLAGKGLVGAGEGIVKAVGSAGKGMINVGKILKKNPTARKALMGGTLVGGLDVLPAVNYKSTRLVPRKMVKNLNKG